MRNIITYKNRDFSRKMNEISSTKKIYKKLKKLQHVLTKETGVTCSDTPTNILAVCNAGLVNGLSEEVIVKHFTIYGSIDNITLLPGKSCCFLSYRSATSAVEAFQNFNGKLCIAQNNKPIYLSFVNSLPDIKLEKSFDLRPPGLIILEDFISELEEFSLLNLCHFDTTSDQMKNRNVKHYGYEFLYDINNVDKNKPLLEKIPRDCNFLWERFKNTNLACNHFQPDQLTVNHYIPGQGIPPHVDTHSAFEDPIVSLSLQSPIVMEFKNENQHYSVLLPPRSLAIMSEECRYDWTHGIIPRKFDVIRTKNGYTTLERNTRVSFTFRKILRGNCKCKFRRLCDSQVSGETLRIEHQIAAQLERLHVHQVYENIASHFSNTRHKPWPNVLEFVQSFSSGDILVDIGCGNGKYLGYNKDVFEIGCDRSFSLLNVCKSRDFEVFSADCLCVPLKSNFADGAISIAVIHHLANEERRLQALKEIVRILKICGKALIYVWSKDQHKNKEKSTYIKQDRKNRRIDTENIVDNNTETALVHGVSLPVHTNRTQFKHRDLLVPWKLKQNAGDITDQNTFLRFYHVFDKMELESLCNKLENVQIIKSFYDQGNWCVIIEKK